MPQPDATHLDRLLALQGVNDTPELLALAGGHLLHSRFAGGAWTAWHTLSGPITDRAPLAAAEPDGTLDVLSVGPDSTVLHSRFVNGVWQDPAAAAGVPAWEADRAALAARDDGTVELVGVGADRVPRHSRFLNGAWTAPGAAGSLTTALRPALGVATDGAAATATLELAFTGEDGRVLNQQFRAGAWEAPRVLASSAGPLMAIGAPVLAAGPGARLDLVVWTAAGLFQDQMQAGTWSDAVRMDGIDAPAIALAALPQVDPPAALELFATAADGGLTYLFFHDGRWTGPAPLGGLLATGPAVPVMR
jgi:hypothetical protein